MAGERHSQLSKRAGTVGYLGGGTVLNLGGERRARPNRVPGQDPVLPDAQQTVQEWFNKSAFTTGFSPAPRAFGNSGVGIMRGPGFASIDWTLAKNFHLAEKRYFQFRTEFFNAFNRANFQPPDVRAENSGFGRILLAGNARIIQFALKFYY